MAPHGGALSEEFHLARLGPDFEIRVELHPVVVTAQAGYLDARAGKEEPFVRAAGRGTEDGDLVGVACGILVDVREFGDAGFGEVSGDEWCRGGDGRWVAAADGDGGGGGLLAPGREEFVAGAVEGRNGEPGEERAIWIDGYGDTINGELGESGADGAEDERGIAGGEF